MPISNTAFSTGVTLPGDGTFGEIMRVDGSDTSATVNVRVISMDLSQDYTLQLAIVPVGTAISTPITNEQLLQPKNIKLGPTGLTGGFLEDVAIIVPAGMKLVGKANVANALVARSHGFKRSQTN